MTNIDERLRKLVKDTRTLLDEFEDALRHHESGDVQGACDAVSRTAYPLSDIGKEWKGTLDAFRADDVHPSREEGA
jgi:hypothetical protein